MRDFEKCCMELKIYILSGNEMRVHHSRTSEKHHKKDVCVLYIKFNLDDKICCIVKLLSYVLNQKERENGPEKSGKKT